MRTYLIALLLAGTAALPAAAREPGGALAALLAAQSAEVRLPPPAEAEPVKNSCRPFLVSAAFGGVGERIWFERRCSAANEAAWAMGVERPGAAVEVVSSERPARRAALERAIRAMALTGLKDAEADFIALTLGPALAAAADAPAAQRPALLAAAEEALAAFLAGR